MFKAFKSSGFNMEATHLVDYDRLNTLFSVMAIAFCILLIMYKPAFTWPGLIIVLAGIPIYYIAVANKRKK